jgi:hypothetical protein
MTVTYYLRGIANDTALLKVAANAIEAANYGSIQPEALTVGLAAMSKYLEDTVGQRVKVAYSEGKQDITADQRISQARRILKNFHTKIRATHDSQYRHDLVTYTLGTLDSVISTDWSSDDD